MAASRHVELRQRIDDQVRRAIAHGQFELHGASQVDEELAVGDAVRWVGPGVWRVEEVAGDRVTLRLWPDNEPYPVRINEVGPGEWPDHAA
jgi:hypothetical protein